MKPPKVKLGNGHIHLPRSRLVRLLIGVALILGGLLGFLPVLGFWMIPLGLIILSADLPVLRRWRGRLALWRRRKRGDDKAKRKLP